MTRKMIVDEQGMVIGFEVVPEDEPAPSRPAAATPERPLGRRQANKPSTPRAYFGPMATSGTPAASAGPRATEGIARGHIACPGCGKSVPSGMLRTHRKSECRAGRVAQQRSPRSQTSTVFKAVCTVCQEEVAIAQLPRHMKLMHANPMGPAFARELPRLPPEKQYCPLCKAILKSGTKRLQRHFTKVHAVLVITGSGDKDVQPQSVPIPAPPRKDQQRPARPIQADDYGRQVEERLPRDPLDATRDFAQFREDGRFGSASSYDDHSDESAP